MKLNLSELLTFWRNLMPKFSCGFFCEDVDQEKNNLVAENSQRYSNNQSIDAGKLPTPASGQVTFTRYNVSYVENYMIIPVGMLVMTPMGKLFMVCPDLSNPYYSAPYNSYICPPLIDSIDTLVVACTMDNTGKPMLGTGGNVVAGQISNVPPNARYPSNCENIMNYSDFKNGQDAPRISPALMR